MIWAEYITMVGKHEKKTFVSDIQHGDIVNDIFAVVSKEPLKEYNNGFGYMFGLKLQDLTGIIDLKYFGSAKKSEVEGLYNSIPAGSIVFIEAAAKEYKGRLGLTINPPNKLKTVPAEEVDSSQFIPSTKKDIGKLRERLAELISGIEDNEIRAVMENIFNPEFTETFSKSSAAVSRHHAFAGGLLEHSISLAEIVITIQKTHPELNRDYLVCGALLQDIGKVGEITQGVTFSFSTEGNLIGHIVLGAQIVKKATEEVKIEKKKALKIIHLVLSHHNKLEQGSPVEPRFPEAVVVALADDLDAKTQEFIEAVENGKNGTDETVYDSKLGRHIYLK